VYELSIPESTAVIPATFTRIGEYIAELEARLGGRAEIRTARERLSSIVQGTGPATLRSMRLALGLSQAELAAKVGTSQPQIARIETGGHDPTYDTFERLARALGAQVTDVVAAFGEARKANRKT
jgi:ribosome-binding protein aMBF1 (putative translation factor)